MSSVIQRAKTKAQDIWATGNAVVNKEEVPEVMKELEKTGELFYADIEMNGLVLIERADS